MPDFQDILYQKDHRVRGAAWITINRPDVMEPDFSRYPR